MKVWAEIAGQSSHRSRSNRWRLVRRIEMLEVAFVEGVDACILLIVAENGMRHGTAIQTASKTN